jgi:hypothetical protein
MPRQGCRFKAAQGIEAVSFFAAGKKDTSGKPGFRRGTPEMRPSCRIDVGREAGYYSSGGSYETVFRRVSAPGLYRGLRAGFVAGFFSFGAFSFL